MEKLMSILSEVFPAIDFDQEKSLIDGGVLDSLDIVTLIGWLNDEFDVSITVEELTPENFNSAESIHAMLERLQNA